MGISKVGGKLHFSPDAGGANLSSLPSRVLNYSTHNTLQTADPERLKTFKTLSAKNSLKAKALALGEDPNVEPGESPISKVFDVMSRPLYTTANEFDYWRNDKPNATNPLDAAWRGASGQDKTTFSKMYAQKVDPNATGLSRLGLSGNIGNAAMGFLSDVVLDPTTYVGLGLAKDAGVLGKSALAADKGVQGAEDLTKVAQAGEKVGALAGEASSAAGASAPVETVADRVLKVADKGLSATSKVGTGTGTVQAARGTIRAADVGALAKTHAQYPLLQGGRDAIKARAGVRSTGVKAFKDSKKAAGESYTIKEANDAGRRAVAEAHAAQTASFAKDTKDLNALVKADPALKVQFKVLGKPIAESEKLGSALSKAEKVFKDSGPGQKLGNAFVRGKGIPSDIYNAFRKSNNLGAAEYGSHLDDLQKAAHGKVAIDEAGNITKEGGTQLTRIDAKDSRTLNRALEGVDGAGRETLPDYLKPHYDFVRNAYTNNAERLIDAKLIDPTQVHENFVQHVYRNTKMDKFGDGSRPTSGFFENNKIAAQRGAKPVEDAYGALAAHTAQTFRKVNNKTLMQNFAEDYGIDIGKKATNGGSIKAAISRGELVDGAKGGLGMPGKALLPEHANAIAKVQELMRPGPASSELAKFYDKVLGKYKILNIATPASRVRHGVGQIFNNYLDGVVNPRRYDQAVSVMRSLEHPESAAQNIFRVDGKYIKDTFDAKDIKKLYEGQGLSSGYFEGEMNIAGRTGARGLPSAPANLVRKVTEGQDNFARTAHFIDAFYKESKSAKTVEEAAANAAARVKRFNFDMRDLTPFEQRVMKRAIPFYTFMRNNVPLQMEMAFAKPGRVSVVPKGQQMLQTLLNPNHTPVGDGTEDPMAGVTGVIPEWLHNLDPLQIAPEGPGQNSEYVSSFDPFSEAANVVGNRETFANSLTPALSMPIEMATGRDIGTGAPTDKTVAGQLLKNVSVANKVGQLRSGSNQSINVGGHAIPEQLINTLLPLNARQITPTRITGELLRQQDILKSRIKTGKKRQAAQQGAN